MNFNWFYRICKKREKHVESDAQYQERVARNERYRNEFIGICLIAAIWIVAAASCHVLGIK